MEIFRSLAVYFIYLFLDPVRVTAVAIHGDLVRAVKVRVPKEKSRGIGTKKKKLKIRIGVRRKKRKRRPRLKRNLLWRRDVLLLKSRLKKSIVLALGRKNRGNANAQNPEKKKESVRNLEKSRAIKGVDLAVKRDPDLESERDPGPGKESAPGLENAKDLGLGIGKNRDPETVKDPNLAIANGRSQRADQSREQSHRA